MTNLEQIIADLRRELAQLTAERRELLAERDEAYRTLDHAQAATVEVLQVINASPGDLAPVFNAILEQAHRICGAELGALVVYEGKHFRAVATHDYPPEYEALIRQPFGAEASAYQRLVNGERYIHIPDVVAVPTPGLEDAIRLTAINVAGIRTVLLVPLLKENAFLGYFSAQRREVRPFSEREITLIESFAAQAVIAMENARLLDELRERTEQIADLNRGLEARVAEQVEELGRVGRLKRFLAPQLAEMIVSQGNEKILESHRREIVVVFCDLRGYTAFTETAEPEEVWISSASITARWGR